MKEHLRNYIIEKVITPKEEEIEEILKTFKIKEFKKGDYFKKPFTIGNDMAFIVNGAVREVFCTENGEELTVKIHEKYSLIADVHRLENKEMSPIGLKCFENQTLLVCTYDSFELLLETNLTLNILARKYLCEKIIEVGKQQLLFITGSSKERYEFLINQNPDILNKYPLKYIASMIGITPTQLSRLRNIE